MNLSNFLKRNPTSGELRNTIKKLEAELQAAEKQRAELLAQREEVYFEGSPESIRKHQASIGRVADDVDRLTVQITGLGKRLAEAEAREHQQQMDALVVDAEALQRRGLELFEKYRQQALEVVNIVEELQAVSRGIATANDALAKGDDLRRVDHPEKVAMTRDRPSVGYRLRFWNQIVLPDPTALPPIFDGRREAP